MFLLDCLLRVIQKCGTSVVGHSEKRFIKGAGVLVNSLALYGGYLGTHVPVLPLGFKSTQGVWVYYGCLVKTGKKITC